MQKSDDATSAEVQQPPVPKVPRSAWRWPPAWPFPDDFMEVLSPQVGVSEGFTADSIEAVRRHLGFYITDGAQVLEIGACESSVLPNSKTFASVSGVPMKTGALKAAVVNDIEVDDSLLDHEGVLNFPTNSMDYVVISSGIEYVSRPQALLRDVLRVLKPGGMVFTFFSSSGLDSTLSPLKMWTTMNDEQKIWVAGAYYHYAGGESYQDIEGYDLLSNGEGTTMVFEKKGSEGQSVYCVQAAKVILPPVEMTYNYTVAALAGSRHMDKDDIKFVAMRCEGAYINATTPAEKDAVIANVMKFSELYSILKDVKEVVIPKPVKAMLAVFLADKWTGSQEEKGALRMSTGLDTPSEEFWKPLGLMTASMAPRDKINFLAETVPLFGGGADPEIRANYPSVLEGCIELIKKKLPDAEIGDVQLIASDLTCTDYLSGTSSRERFFKYLEQAPPSFFKAELQKRKEVW